MAPRTRSVSTVVWESASWVPLQWLEANLNVQATLEAMRSKEDGSTVRPAPSTRTLQP